MPDASKHETTWTQSITNESVCQYFYVIFFVTALLAAIAVGMDVLLMFKRPALGMSMLIRSAPALILAIANSLFLYILCARTLLK